MVFDEQQVDVLLRSQERSKRVVFLVAHLQVGCLQSVHSEMYLLFIWMWRVLNQTRNKARGTCLYKGKNGRVILGSSVYISVFVHCKVDESHFL